MIRRRIAATIGLLFLGATTVHAQTTAADYRQLGLDYRQQGDLEAAIAAFEQAVSLQPEHINGQVLLGWTQHLAGDRQAATETLLTTFYQDPFAVPTSNALGIVYLVNGDLTDAAIVHTWAAILKPDNEIAYYNLSLTYQRLGQYELAIEQGQRAAELKPTNPHPPIAIAIAHWSSGDLQQAQQTYQQALALDGRYGDAAFLEYLGEAGFSDAQITIATTVLNSL